MEDHLATALIPADICELFKPAPTKWKALVSTGNGDCLFNSVSLLINGDESLASELRAETSTELLNNVLLYRAHPHIQETSVQTGNPAGVLWQSILSPAASVIATAENMSNAITYEANKTSTPREWGSLLHVFALSSIIQSDIISVYPSVSNYILRPLLHSRIHPIRQFAQNRFKLSNRDIVVMWTCDGTLDTTPDALFQPNHVVPLVPLLPDPLEISTGSTGSKSRRKQQTNLLTFFSAPAAKKQCISVESVITNGNNVPQRSTASNLLESEHNINNDQNLPHNTSQCALDCTPQQTRDPVTTVSDISNVINRRDSEISPVSKFLLIQNRLPETNFRFPPKLYKDINRKGGVKQRYCSRDWLSDHGFLSYSKSTDGLFCLCCVLFPVAPAHGQRAKVLINRPYNNWKDARADLQNHACLQYHRDSKVLMDAFVEVMLKPELDIEARLSVQENDQSVKNRKFLISIIKCLELCGRQGIALRGHRDDSNTDSLNQGNFKALLNMRVDAGDTELREHLETGARNASYISKTSQNALLDCIKKFIQDHIVQQVKTGDGGGFYGIEADEVTDTSNWEQLGLVVRYVHNGEPVERLVEYIACESCTGKVICDQIVKSLTGMGLDPKMCRAQTYDGAGNMAGCQNGCAKNFQSVSPRAPYFHCASHELNLALSHASKVDEIHKMVCALKSIGIFFKYSPKRQREFEEAIVKTKETEDSRVEGEMVESDDEDTSGESESGDDDDFEDGDVIDIGDSTRPEEGATKPMSVEKLQTAKKKIKPLCETRWVERHTSLDTFNELYEPLLLCMENISMNKGSKKWDSKSKTDAQGLLHQMRSPVFIAAFQTAVYLFGYTKALSQTLQGSTLDVIAAYEHISLVKEQFRTIRQKAKQEFVRVYDKMVVMSKKANVKMTIPRRCGRQTLRQNVKGKKPITYFRRTLFIPFIDGLLQQFGDRFQGSSAQAVLGLVLIPSNLRKLDSGAQDRLVEYYTPDLPSASNFHQEMQLWKGFWSGSEEKPTTLVDTLASSNGRIFPNIHTILQLLAITPVTSATVERGNSALRHVKTVYRSTMGEDRLNALLLLFIHKNVTLNYDAIVDEFARREPRRMSFANPLQ